MSAYAEGSPVSGPCTAWVDAQAVAACIGVDVDSSTQERLDDAAAAASELLFPLSGQQWNGGCEQTVRPHANGCGCWAWVLAPMSPGAPQIPAYSWGVWGGFGWGWGYDGGDDCVAGCGALSRALLSGYPVTRILAVDIAGEDIPEYDGDGWPNWRLDGWRYLTRMADADGGSRFWPACQRLDMPAGEPGTWSVTYTFGTQPPLLGEMAAQQLAGEIYKQCNGQECALPVGTVSFTRQGLAVQRAPFLTWALKDGAWSTGITMVDAFLSAYNPQGLKRPPVVWSPDLEPYGDRLGLGSGS